MNDYLLILFVTILSYLLGSIPTGYIIGKLKGIDITKQGSGNIGMANVFRTLGPIYGITVLLLDASKGFIPTFIAIELNFPLLVILLVGIFSILGHIFSIFLGFKGGKGVATAAGMFLAISPILTLSSFLVWLTTVLLTRYSSLGSILACLWACFLVLLYQFELIKISLLTFYTAQKAYFCVFVILISIFIIFKHRDNIVRIIKNQEKKLF
ncbi:MAG: glycerol-3-phosphate 1-O-acyltransferase PlsY [bacterium]